MELSGRCAMNKLLSLLVFILLFNVTQAFAQPAAYWCDAPFPPPAGSDRTMGKDSNGQVCIKIAKEVPGPTCPEIPVISAGTTWRVEFAKADYIYHTDIEADVVETVGTFLVLKKDGVEVARYSSKYVLGYVLVEP